MPEGHTIHGIARLHAALLGGRRVRVSSPQGRFAEGAAALDGRVLADVEAYGKHLFHRWENETVLHIHLGLIGVFDMRPAAIEPSPSTRLRLAAAGQAADLSGPMVCELIDPAQQDAIIAALGPDPLRCGSDLQRFVAALTRRRGPIGTVLLDQSVVAGVGNVFRSEALFAVRLHPARSADSLTRAEAERLWAKIAGMLADGLSRGRIVTVDPSDVGVSHVDAVPDGERMLVYKRRDLPCRRCGTAIVERQLGGRAIWLCPVCQR